MPHVPCRACGLPLCFLKSCASDTAKGAGVLRTGAPAPFCCDAARAAPGHELSGSLRKQAGVSRLQIVLQEGLAPGEAVGIAKARQRRCEHNPDSGICLQHSACVRADPCRKSCIRRDSLPLSAGERHRDGSNTESRPGNRMENVFHDCPVKNPYPLQDSGKFDIADHLIQIISVSVPEFPEPVTESDIIERALQNA